MFIPIKDAILDMTPEEFEKHSLLILTEKTKGLENVRIVHDKHIKAHDGNYQLDGYIEFEVMGVLYKSIVECKHYKKPISREIVQKLYDNLRATGAQKGILISSSNFQSGAIQYAQEHGIALIQLTEAGEDYSTRSRLNVVMMHSRTPYNDGIPYIGVLQQQNDIGISCSYLTKCSDALASFLRK